MKKAKLFIGLFLLLGLLTSASQAAHYATPYYAQYWVEATVEDAADGTSPNGREAIIHTADNKGIAVGTVFGNSIRINTLAYQFVTPGTYYISVPRTEDNNYGAGPLEFEITGNGWDKIATALTIAAEAGPGPDIIPPPLPVPPPPGTGELAGKVEDADGNPVADANIIIQDTAFTTQSGNNGTYSIGNINAGTYTVLVAKQGYTAQTISDVTINASDTTTLNIALEQAAVVPPPPPGTVGELSGTLEDPDGNPIAGATIIIEGTALTATTGNDGTFSIENIDPGTYNVTIARDGYIAQTISDVVIQAGETTTLPKITLKEAAPTATLGEISGKVEDKDKQPIAEVSIAIEGTALSVNTNKDGNFLIAKVDPGDYTVSVSKKWYEPQSVADVTVVAGQTTRLNFSLEKVKESSPQIGKITFGNRVFQKALVEKGEPFIISPTPDMKVEISIEEPFSLPNNIGGYSITIDPGTSSSKKLTLQAQEMTSQAFAIGSNQIQSFNLSHTITEAIPGGKHTLAIAASSSGSLGQATIATVLATVEVMGGALRVIGTPIIFPSPFSPTQHSVMYIQYQLSQDSDVDIYVYSIGGELVKKIACPSRGEGGSAGINKVSWDGRMDVGGVVGNGIYMGSVIAREENRQLGKVKISVFD